MTDEAIAQAGSLIPPNPSRTAPMNSTSGYTACSTGSRKTTPPWPGPSMEWTKCSTSSPPAFTAWRPCSSAPAKTASGWWKQQWPMQRFPPVTTR